MCINLLSLFPLINKSMRNESKTCTLRSNMNGFFEEFRNCSERITYQGKNFLHWSTWPQWYTRTHTLRFNASDELLPVICIVSHKIRKNEKNRTFANRCVVTSGYFYVERESWGTSLSKWFYIIWRVCDHKMAIQIGSRNKRWLALLGIHRNRSHPYKQRKQERKTILSMLPQALDHWSTNSKIRNKVPAFANRRKPKIKYFTYFLKIKTGVFSFKLDTL